MAKNTKTEVGLTEHHERLAEIAAIKFEKLSDDEVLRLLAERKRLEELQAQYQKLQKEEEERVLLEKRNAEKLKEKEKQRALLEEQIETLNRSITPDKADEELLALVAERKILEEELENVGQENVPSLTEETAAETISVAVAGVPESQIASEDLSRENNKNAAPKEESGEVVSPVAEPSKIVVAETIPVSFDQAPSELKSSLKEEFGQEGIRLNDFKEEGELHRYLDQLKNNTGALGTLLQEMPLDAKRNKAFMLQVAEIDSAYAMHYADKDTLKQDEDFNIRIASMKNPRNSGNALAEMLPEARTSKVVLAAVKQDYQNVRFIQPNMAEYDEIMNIAKKVALKKIAELKDATDVLMLIPRPLQQDKQFMSEVAKITTEGKK